MCPFVEYRDIKNHKYLFCVKTDEICNFSKYCRTQNKYILNERWEQCSIMNKKEIPSGSYEVVSEVKGNLYIDMGDKAIKVKNTLNTDKKPDYVYVRDGIEGYEISLSPFPIEQKKKTTTKKK